MTATEADPVRALLRAQVPQWAGLPLRRVAGAGTEHAVWRLGSDLVVRMPRTADAEAGLVTEQAWLPHLAGRLPLPLPELVHAGRPGSGFPHAWSVQRWLPGEDAGRLVHEGRQGTSWPGMLAAVIAALRAIDLSEASTPPVPRSSRGGTLAERVEGLDPVLAELGDRLPHGLAERVLQPALEVADDPPRVLLHADLIPGNLLVRDGRLAGLIDLGTLTVGRPAWDLTCAWWVLGRTGRQALRSELGEPEGAWLQGRAFAFVQAVLATWYYTPRGHPLAPQGDRVIAEMAAEVD